ncbi:MAG: S8 family serine peptidase, partial [Desulfobulbaceae bacterium]|nr:S8 family serine peptidase [Desulfobulbaceae bacterium]
PSNNAEISLSGDTFSWTEAPKVSTYQVEFYETDQELPFFKAYTRKGVYEVSANILKMKFAAAKNYFWQVKGYNDAGELAAESTRKGFSLLDSALYVQGQILFLVDNNDDGKNLIVRLAQQFGLKVLEQNTLVSINRILVVGFTNGNVQSMITQLQKVDGLYNPQPNYIFSTMSDEDPLRSMQSIHSLVDLDTIHLRSQGKNVRVAIIDTGVDIEHRDLKDRIGSHLNFVADSTYQSEIHGTAVASIIGASRNDFGILGIAPGSEILAYRACRQKSSSKP